MKKILNKLIRNEEGQVLILALILLVVGALIIAPLMGFMSTGLKVGQLYEKNMNEFYAADSGIEKGIWTLLNGGTVSTYELNNADVVVTIVAVTPTDTQMDTFGLREDGTVYQVTSTATTDIDSSTTLEVFAELTTGDDPTTYPEYPGGFNLGDGESHTGDVYTDENAQLGIGATINGNVYAEGNVQLYDDAVITGDVYGGGNVHLYGYAIIGGDVIAEGNVQLYDDAVITGDVCAGQNVQLYDGAQITGDVYCAQDVQLYNEAIIGGDVHVYPGASVGPVVQIMGTVYDDYSGCPLSFGDGGIEIITLDII